MQVWLVSHDAAVASYGQWTCRHSWLCTTTFFTAENCLWWTVFASWCLLLCRHRVPALLVSSVGSSALQSCHFPAAARRPERQLDGHEDPGAAQAWPRHPQQTQYRLFVQGSISYSLLTIWKMNHKAQGFKINLISDVEMQLKNSFNLRVIKDSSTTLS